MFNLNQIFSSLSLIVLFGAGHWFTFIAVDHASNRSLYYIKGTFEVTFDFVFMFIMSLGIKNYQMFKFAKNLLGTSRSFGRLILGIFHCRISRSRFENSSKIKSSRSFTTSTTDPDNAHQGGKETDQN